MATDGEVPVHELHGYVHMDRLREGALEKCISAWEMEHVPNKLIYVKLEEVNDKLGTSDCQHTEQKVQAEAAK